jgi:hypothetical protein
MAEQPLLGRIVEAVLRRVKQGIDHLYAVKHPGRFALLVIDAFAPIVRHMPANDRWSLGVHAPYWAKALSYGGRFRSAANPKRIFIFAVYRGQFTLDLTLAVLLASRGHEVTVGYLPKLRSPVKPPLQDHPSASRYLAGTLGRVEKASGGRIRTVDLAEFESVDAPISEAFLERQVRSDLVMRLGQETPDLTEPEGAEAAEYYERLGRHAQRTAYGFLATRARAIDLCIVPNGTTFEGAHVCQVARGLGIEFNTLEKFAFRRIRVLNHGDDFRAFHDLDAMWLNRDALGFTDPEFKAAAVKRALELMDERRRSSKATWAWALQGAPEQEAESAMREAGIDPQKPFVLVCTNVPYDAGYDRLIRIFPSMRTWLIETVRALLSEGELQVVVRCHPGEAAHYGGRETSHENLAQAGFRPGGRLVVIPGHQTTNTYGLMERCKFGVVFSSTTGLELAMLGKQALAGSDVYYGKRGFTIDVDSREEYVHELRRLCAQADGQTLRKDQADDAALFHFLLHFMWQWPYPYDKAGDVVRKPLADLLASSEMQKYHPTLDALALSRTEFEARIAEFLSVRCCQHLPKLDSATGGK